MPRKFRVVGSSNPYDVFDDFDALRREQVRSGRPSQAAAEGNFHPDSA